MNKENKILVMLIGKTHSGKTTFAQEIKNEVKDILVLEADPIAVFMKEHFPELRESDDHEHSGLFENMSLKYRTFSLFVEFALSIGKPIILSNSNMWLKGRALVLDVSKRFNYKVIGVYFDLGEAVLLERAQGSGRSLDVLRASRDFQDLILKQRSRMQPPDSSEFDEFYTIKSEEDVKKVRDELMKIIT